MEHSRAPELDPGRDHGALDVIWRRERRWVAAVLLAHMPREEDLEDLLQEVALALVKNVAKIRDPKALRPWLRTVALNVARGTGRKVSVRRRRQRALPDADVLADPRREREMEIEEARAACDRVLELAEQLPADFREPLILRCVRGLSQRRIAEILGVPETTVETRLARARRKLREAMMKENAARRRGRAAGE